MAIEKVSFGNCIIFALALAEVTSWTIDLPEVRKYVFEKNAREIEKEKKYEEFIYKKPDSDLPLYYNNIEGNSKHNSKHYEDIYENTAYAREYGYESYMEKKVHDIVYNGSVYLEGLRRSLENYTSFLERCNRINSTMRTSQNTTWRPPVEAMSSNSSNTSSNSPNINSTLMSRCREVSSTSEHVRRLSELAMWATRELQDIAYARKYHKGDGTSLGMEENELILKLAWFLDRLAHYTGYEPESKDFVNKRNDTTTTTTTAPIPAGVANASAEATRQMMDCLQSNSSGDAVDRCRYPEPLSPLVQMMMDMNSNITGIPSIPVSQSSNVEDLVMPISRSSRSDPLSEQSMELLVASDNRAPSLNLLPTLTAVRHVQKRSVSSMVQPEVAKSAGELKRTDDFLPLIENDPVLNFLKYYAKHKVWEGSNLRNIETKFQEFEIRNHLAPHNIQKRAIDDKMSKHLRLPENPFQDLTKYIKHKPGINYIKDEALAEKIKQALEKMDEKPSSSKNLFKKLIKIVRAKRHVTYEKDVDLPRESVDPQKDISYYTKNKEGRIYNNNLQQTAQVRAGLEQIFNTGNIEIVRRFGANYNPANPNPFISGQIISQADF